MIAGNVSLNPLSTPHLPAFNDTSNHSSLFLGRSVRHGSNRTDLRQIVGDDPARQKIVENILKGDGEIMMRNITKQIANKTVDPSRFGQPFLGKTTVSDPIDITEPLILDDRTSNSNQGEFVRVGNQSPGLLLEVLHKRKVNYKFGGNRALLKDRTQSSEKNIELSNCFYRKEEFNETTVIPKTANRKLQKLTGSIMNSCHGIGKKAYSGQFDVNIDMKKTDDFTLFRMMPHSEGNQYLDKNNKVHKLPMDSSAETYRTLVKDGMRFEDSGASPLAMKVKEHNGKHFFVVEQRADYSSFKLADNRCEMPFEGIDTSLDRAICCTDGVRQKQDVKYLYYEQLKNNTFNVKFSVDFSDFTDKYATGLPLTTLAINDELVARSYGWTGNNNMNKESEPCGYHVQFGIADPSEDSVVVKISDPEFNPEKRLDLDGLATKDKIPFRKMNGECQRSPFIEAIKHRHQYQGSEVMTYDQEFARVGMQGPELLTEQFTKDDDVIYTFKNQLMNKTAEMEKDKDVELTNCFYSYAGDTERVGKSRLGPGKRGRLKIATGEYLAGCVGSSRGYSFGDFDLKVDMGGQPGNVTVFRMLPQNIGRQYINSAGKTVYLPLKAGISKYLEMKDNGVLFGGPGDSPLTMNVEHYDGEHFFTVKTRSNYAMFKNPANPRCDIPFEGENTPVNVATCCNDELNNSDPEIYTSSYQEEDVKYLHISPLKSGWFNVKFYLEFTNYAIRQDFSKGTVALSINNKPTVTTNIGLGNNNFFYGTSSVFKEDSGYYSQFGISGASHDAITVQIKNPDLQPDKYIDLHTNPIWKNVYIPSVGKANIVGECGSKKK